jgi:hypothetical protein
MRRIIQILSIVGLPTLINLVIYILEIIVSKTKNTWDDEIVNAIKDVMEILNEQLQSD